MRELCRLEFGAGAEAGARRLLGDKHCSDGGVLKYLELRRLFIIAALPNSRKNNTGLVALHCAKPKVRGKTFEFDLRHVLAFYE